MCCSRSVAYSAVRAGSDALFTGNKPARMIADVKATAVSSLVLSSMIHHPLSLGGLYQMHKTED
jgi:hypothetical protein